MIKLRSKNVTASMVKDRFVSVGFLVLLLVPLIIAIVNLGKNDRSLASENRNKEAWPKSDLLTSNFTAYTAQVNRFMSDHVGFREWFLELHAKSRYRLLNRTVSDKATIGLDGWLYYSENDALKNVNALADFGDIEAMQWLRPLQDYQTRVERNGGKLVVILVPEKHHVYPEFLPPQLQYSRSGRRADVIERMADASGIKIINLLDKMLAAKDQGKLYLKSDSHWTQRGAYVAYKELIKQLRLQNIKAPFAPWHEMQRMDSIRGSGDLADLLNLNDYFEESYERFIPVHKQSEYIEPSNRPSMLLLGDSFSARLHDFLPNSFAGALFIHHRFRSLPTNVLEVRKPDIVIIEVIERSLGTPFIIVE